MCFYAITDLSCGDWKWGNLKERCLHQHRIGESCGVKLVHPDYATRTELSCTVCRTIAAKQRQLARLDSRIERWLSMPGQFSASLSKALSQKEEYLTAVKLLQRKRVSVINGDVGDRLTQRDTPVYPRISVDESIDTAYLDPASPAQSWLVQKLPCPVTLAPRGKTGKMKWSSFKRSTTSSGFLMLTRQRKICTHLLQQ